MLDTTTTTEAKATEVELENDATHENAWEAKFATTAATEGQSSADHVREQASTESTPNVEAKSAETTTETPAEESDYFGALFNTTEKKIEETSKINVKEQMYDELMSDPLIVRYREEKAKRDISFADLLKEVNPKSYSANSVSEGEATFRATLEAEGQTADDIEDQWDEYLNGRESLNFTQKKTLDQWAKDLNAKNPSHGFTKKSNEEIEQEKTNLKEAEAKWHTNEATNFKEYSQKRLAAPLKVGDIEYKFTPEQLSKGQELLNYVRGGGAINENGQTSELMREIFNIAANHATLFSDFVSLARTNGEISIKEQQSNITNTSSRSVPNEMTNKRKTLQDEWSEAQEELS